MRKTVLFLTLVLAALTAVGQGEVRVPPEARGRVMLDVGRQLGPQARIRLQKAAEYHGRYYCQFRYEGYSPYRSGSMFYSVDKRTHEVMPLPWAEDARDSRDTLFVFHDTLFLAHFISSYKHDHYFDTMAACWVECPRLEGTIYEDDEYRVYENDHGEWGQTLWFEERRTGREWESPGLGNVRRVGDTFYIVCENLVRSFPVGRMLASDTGRWNHRCANEDYLGWSFDASPLLDADTVYRDPRYDGFQAYIGRSHDTVIVGSFVSGDSLLLVVNRPDGTALMCIGGQQELRTVRLLDGLYCYKPTSGSSGAREISAPGRMLTDRVLIPFFRDYLSMGLLDIRGGRIEVLEFGHNIDTLDTQPADGLDTLLAYLRDHWDSITDSAIHRFESVHGGTFMGTKHIESNGYFEDRAFRKGNHIDYYSKHIDTLYTLGLEYCVREGDGRVMALLVDVQKWRCYNCEQDRLGNKERHAQEICRKMTARLDAICGRRHFGRTGREYSWHYGSLTVIYEPARSRMLVY